MTSQLPNAISTGLKIEQELLRVPTGLNGDIALKADRCRAYCRKQAQL